MPKTVRDLVAVTGLCKESIYAGIKTGEVPGYYIGGRVTVPDEAFEDFVHGRWSPKPRPLFPNGITANPQVNATLVQPRDLIRKVG